MKNPGEVISDYIARTGMTPAELAKQCKIAIATIYNAINNTYAPTPLTCSKIARGTFGHIAYEELTDKVLTVKRRRNIRRLEEKRSQREQKQ